MAEVSVTQVAGIISAVTSLAAVLPELIGNVEAIVATWKGTPDEAALMDQINSLHDEIQKSDQRLQALKSGGTS